MNSDADIVEELLRELDLNFTRSYAYYSMRLFLNDLFKNKREFILSIDATKKSKYILTGYVQNREIRDRHNTLENINLLNEKSTIGKFFLDKDGYIKYSVAFEFNMIQTLFTSKEVKKRMLNEAINRIVVFFDNNYRSFTTLSEYTESIPDFMF